MPVTMRDLGGPPKGPPDLRLLFAGIFIVFLLVLGGRALLAGSGMATPPAFAPTAIVVTPTPAPLATLAIAYAATSEPTPPPAATAVAAPTSAPTAPGCPAAVALPEGLPVGWVARATGCADVVLANLGGQRRWVLRGDLSDEIFLQLPEVQP